MTFDSRDERRGVSHLIPQRAQRIPAILLLLLLLAGLTADGLAQAPDDEARGQRIASLAAELIPRPPELNDPDPDDSEIVTVEPDPFVFPLTRRKQVIGTKMVPMRFTEKTITVPVYEYETYFKRVPIKDQNGYTVGHEMVEARRPGKQIGEKQITRQVRDPEGQIERDVKVSVYGPGGPDVLPGEWLGNNAMALYALARAARQSLTEPDRGPGRGAARARPAVRPARSHARAELADHRPAGSRRVALRTHRVRRHAEADGRAASRS